ncbi:MAG: ATP phosphoribosyltransferase regulatory subunit [Alphaproteobacteria bacterium]|nr:MAG: ATP phosphoribosyltransferase regulatory subunit [Alphaproteobacteria bacterium]
MDKTEKIGVDGVSTMLRDEIHLSDDAIAKCIDISKVNGVGEDVLRQVQALGVKHVLLDEGLEELAQLSRNLGDVPANTRVHLDMSITRGLAYYTGNVFETELERGTIKASVCSGGRYENLVGDMVNAKLPGVGISIGLSRLMAIMIAADLLPKRAPTPTQVMVAYTPGITQQMQIAASQMLRRQGM